MPRLLRLGAPASLAVALVLAMLAGGCGTGAISGDDDPGGDDSGGGGGSGDAGSGDAGSGGGSADAGPDHAAGEPAELAGITAAHNQVRAGVGVGPMTWNPALAATARAWGEGCVDQDDPIGLIDHNPGRSDGHPYYVGENIYGAGGGATGPDAVANWASESASYDYAANSCTGVCGHYTQVVWATSVDLGCALSTCAGLGFGNAIICDYGPGGNDGGRPY